MRFLYRTLIFFSEHRRPQAEYEGLLEELLLSDLDVAARRVPQLLRKAANDPRAEKAAPLYEAVPSFFFFPYPLLSSRIEEVRKDSP